MGQRFVSAPWEAAKSVSTHTIAFWEKYLLSGIPTAHLRRGGGGRGGSCHIPGNLDTKLCVTHLCYTANWGRALFKRNSPKTMFSPYLNSNPYEAW